ncbi:hypothetical protein PCANC_20335 [Puccinia coronata f. sp. avenae]|uniref:chitin deacetylase n=1 Tax=Puccinia coronata f. sp. avenae TaxID=200324 RepID=A0A2N5TZJ6_9BASI|nr:hypothetical protein PCANC_20335 [Puccinia coronata f. sp. avenae]
MHKIRRVIGQHHRRFMVLLCVVYVVWILRIMTATRGESSLSAGGVFSLRLWERFPGRRLEESNEGEDDSHLVRLEWRPIRSGWSRRLLVVKLTVLDWLGRWNVINSSYTSSGGQFLGYPAVSQIGPKPKREWIRRLQYIQSGSPHHRLIITDEVRRSLLDIPVARLEKDGLVSYPSHINSTGPASGICSWERSGCLRSPEHGYVQDLDVLHSDPFSWVVNFDDGPLPPSESLYHVLDQFNLTATHFWIGGNVLKHWRLALVADRRGDHLAVHTWSHSHLTSLTNQQILGELGWTMQIIADLTGKVPRFFRPPYGNIDNRVRAIAKHVFGLETVLWNFDTVDWALNQTYATGDQVDAAESAGGAGVLSVETAVEGLREYIKQSSFAQRGALVLEHELSDEAVEVFRRSCQLVLGHGASTSTSGGDSHPFFRTVGPLPACLKEGEADWYNNNNNNNNNNQL